MSAHATRRRRWSGWSVLGWAPRRPLRVLSNVRTFRGALAGAIHAEPIADGWAGLLRAALRAYRVDVIFLNCPQAELVILAALLHCLPWTRCRLVVADLNLQRPRTWRDWVVVTGKRVAFWRVDRFLLIHRDFAAYTRYYGIDARRVEYVPWKVNGLEHGPAYFDGMGTAEGEYVFAGGVTHRDWATLAEATAGLSLPVVISLPEASQIVADGLTTTLPDLAAFRCPVRLHRNTREPRSWLTVAAKAKFCVLPISPHSINPSGISTGLALMALGKCLIITEGESTRGILGPAHVVTVPPGDPQALRAAILAVDELDELRRQIAEAGKALALSHGDTARLHDDWLRAMQRLVWPAEALTVRSQDVPAGEVVV